MPWTDKASHSRIINRFNGRCSPRSPLSIQLTLILIAVAVVLGIIWWVSRLMHASTTTEIPQTERLIDYLPDSAAVILRFSPDSALWAAQALLLQIPQEQLYRDIFTVAAASLEHGFIAQALGSVHSIGADSTACLFAFMLGNEPEGKTLHPLLDSLPFTLLEQKEKKDVHGFTLRAASHSSDSLWFGISFSRLLFLTPSKNLAQAAILSSGKRIFGTVSHENLSVPDLQKNPDSGFALAIFPSYAVPLISNDLASPYSRHFSRLHDWAPRIDLQVIRSGSNFTFHGYSYVSDSLSIQGEVFATRTSERIRTLTLLPSGVDILHHVTLPSDDQAISAIEKYQWCAPFSSSGFTSESLRANLKLFQDLGSTQVTLARLSHSNPQLGRGGGCILILPVRSVSQAVETFKPFLQQPERVTSTILHAGEAPTPHPMRDTKFFEKTLGGFFQDKPMRWVMPYQGTLLFAETKELLLDFLDQRERNQQFHRGQPWKSVASALREEATALYYLYLYPHLDNHLSREVLTPATLEQIERSFPIESPLCVALQMSAVPNMLYYNGAIARPASAAPGQSRPRWSIRLDTPVNGRPYVVKSHRSPNAEILLQDLAGNLYLLDHTASPLWKVKLNALMIGEPQQVDLYGNGKLQYAFTTQNGFHIVDRNGSAVSPFPASGSAPLTAPIAIMDYDKRHNYRFASITNRFDVTLLDKRAQPVPGFRSPRLESTTPWPLQHVRCKSRDYLILCDSNRMYILDRKGNERVAQRGEPIRRARYAPIDSIPSFGSEGSLITIERNGTIVSVDLKSGVIKRHGILPGWDESMNPAAYLDVSQPRAIRIYHTCGPHLFVGTLDLTAQPDEAYKPISSKKFAENLYPWLQLFDFGTSGKRLGVSEGGNIWLLDPLTLNPASGFPISGAGPFSITRLVPQQGFSIIAFDRNGQVLIYDLPH